MANTKRNSVREDSAPTKRKRKDTSTGEGRLARFKAFFGDERVHKVVGLFLVLGSAYLLVAFTSFLFTWRIDQDLIGRTWSEIFSPEVHAENWLGKVGALTANRFMYTWFGLSAFGMVLWSFLGGVRILLGNWLLPPRRTLGWTAMAMIWLPTVLGFAFRGEYMFLGGGIGFAITKHLTALLGNFGTGALIVFGLGAFVTFTFNPNFSWVTDLMARLTAKTEKVLADEADEEIALSAADLRMRNKVKEVFAEEEIVPAQGQDEDPEVEEIDEESAAAEAVADEVEEPMALELETAPMEVMEPVGSPVVSSLDGLTGNLNGMDVSAGTEEVVLSEDQIEDKLKEFGEYDPKLDLSNYELPPIDLLIDHGTGELTVTKEELEQNKDRIVETLGHYNIGIDKIKATIGPTVTLYEIIPKAGVRISKIKNLEDDIALSLAALGIRIIAPIPGKGTIGIEVPNSKPQIVGMRGVIASEKFQNSNMELPLVLGKTISNETFVTDLTKMPHLLMAGATGQGKSVGLNAILVSLLYKKHPSQIKFVLVDPKKVELTLFNKIERHFLAKLPGDSDAIITDTKKVVATLNSLCIEMDERYELLKDAQVRNIKEYNTKFIKRRLNPENGHRFLPYIVLVVDEFADLIMTAGREVETPIARLAQLARAIGIHLIIATQRPSVNIITGTIKANFPARIAFRVTSKIDSRTILDSGGADQLIGRGDMLLSTGNDLIRIQCAFVDTPEVDKICDFIGNQRGYPEALILPEVPTDDGDGGGDMDSSDRDSMFEDAARLVVMTQQGSTSLIQRKLKLGYNRAGRIVDQLEAAGILGGFEGSKARRVMVANETALEALLRPVDAGGGNF
ncbi:MAG TPA: DNA translocase FtsK 4TM domain-containing protein [Flavobacteriales bacterium]|nr:DNA translocase FtsK 4TM domain-containing protein [Flavobacteriales bacterium]MBK7103222.1 DNA translocase FtsK 4TM domain-containing protein [Flavobacteriales bacterium]MBK7620189.1 DNA translocase FtsK 4TM domain-containing protein [Flavobacteriales bacterium]MBK8707207.1 DNA translocase FtsK 4TM domain-containing protein [Flavobacteriales bacterium]HQW05895.1 DNA translocase FtsK 4TM domain-containing protein [Flavobacteriales bacterium]